MHKTRTLTKLKISSLKQTQETFSEIKQTKASENENCQYQVLMIAY